MAWRSAISALVLLTVHYRVGCGCGDTTGPSDGDPRVVSAVINGGAAYATGPLLRFAVRAEGSAPPFAILSKPADARGECPAPASDAGFLAYAAPQSAYDVAVTPVDGTHKLCAWVLDSRGRMSSIAPSTGRSGFDVDTIELHTAGAPIVERLVVTNNQPGPRFGGRLHSAGDSLSIAWVVADREGLADGPVNLYLSVDGGSEVPIILGHGSSGGLTRYAGIYTGFHVPVEGPFRVKLVAVDAAGNLSSPVYSELQNNSAWSVYAGTPAAAVGASALSARFVSEEASGTFDIDPVTHDLYLVSRNDGVLRVDARTGKVDRLFEHGDLNLPDEGPLPARPAFERGALIKFGPDRRLYLMPLWPAGQAVSKVLYQIDLQRGSVRRYAGGGTRFDASATPATVFMHALMFDFDEDGSLYFLTSCTPGSWTATSGGRLMKLTQNPDGTPGMVGIVAGDCTRGVPPVGPSDPLAVPAGDFTQPGVGSIAVWGRGRYVYYAPYNTRVSKIIDGQLYASDLPVSQAGSLMFNHRDGRLYATTGEVTAYVPNLLSAGGDLPGVAWATNDGGLEGRDDGAHALQARVNAHSTVRLGPDGTLYFVDGPRLNGLRPYRVRFVDGEGRLRTRAGLPPLWGEGRDRRVVVGRFAGIHFKQASAPNQTAFPSALYFADGEALVFGHVNPATDAVAVDWGDQSGAPVELSTGTEIGAGASLGVEYVGGNAMAMTFDDNGLPWLRVGGTPVLGKAHLVRLNAARRVDLLQAGTVSWETAPDGADPSSLQLWPYGGWQGLALKGNAAFLLGGYSVQTTGPVIKLLDFGAATTTRLVGSNAAAGSTPDVSTPGTVSTNSTLSASCLNRGSCPVAYRADEDRLYFVEGASLRYLTTPGNRATSTLGTLWSSTGALESFTFSPDGSQLFFVRSGQLHCHDLSSGQPWCQDAALGPPPPLSPIAAGPNQFTWSDAQSLMISTYGGEIYLLHLGAL